ncbi:LamG-like jellyroll fold domain-containing protein [Catenovulum agarivorans]|uniref:LamG-like jellyroll fold domain-containing protein n=1 Tax=Catenovulum agarivorans TaxID=1172192 RepID=UPI00030D9647|nr:LamG-like jellyroll fold domain-containing protein [Catenovulum agarivorans]
MKRSEKFSEIRKIADDICSGSATEGQVQQLKQQLKDNLEAKRFYFDYIRVNEAMKSGSERNMEVVYERISEKLTIRPHSDKVIDDPDDFQKAMAYSLNEPTNAKRYTKLAIIVAAILFVIVAAVVIWALKPNPTVFSANIVEGKLAIVGKGRIDANTLYSGDYQVVQDARVELSSGDTLYLSSGAQVKLVSDNEVALKAGELKIEPVSGSDIAVHGANFELRSNGDPLSIDLTAQQPIVTSGNNTVLYAKRWRPTHYWPFDGRSDRVINAANDAHGIASPGAIRVHGIVGSGAFSFDNGRDARIDVGSGGGTAPATGSFSVTDGITIEALIQPQFTGKRGEQDEIFRKGGIDGEFRFHLSFQHDTWKKDYISPIVNPGASLSFGLYLVGPGYHELKLPLDGKDGRPTLAKLKDGSTYHIVASYDVNTGFKAIYMNGQLLASQHYAPGVKMLTGGPGPAVIGGNPTWDKWEKFAFSGVIDELAIYDFALPPFVISQHIEQVQQGKNYYGLRPTSAALPEQIKINLPPESRLVLDALTGLPQKVLK